MASVNQNQVVGSLIPDVYIKKITLESTGHALKETNPHIRHPRENKSKFASSKKDMGVHLDLSIKDTHDSGLIDTWFSDQDFKKYLKLTVVQCTDPLATKILSASNNALRMVNIDSLGDALAFLSQLLETIKDLPEFAADHLSTASALEVYQIISNNIVSQSVSFNQIVGDNSLLSQHYSSGQGLYDICHRVSFTHTTNKPAHLSYFATTSIDLDQLANDFNLYIDNSFVADLLAGKTILDVVIDAGAVKSKTFVYKDLNGNIWTGPVRKTDSGWMSGGLTEESGLVLTKETIENNKVQDFRIFERLERASYDFSFIENELFGADRGFRRLSNAELMPRTSVPYFTELALTRDHAGQSKFLFGVDYGKLVQENTRFGNLYSALNKDELLKNVKIRNMILKRRRVTNERFGLNKLGSPVNGRDLFDESSQAPLHLALSGEKMPGIFLPAESRNGTISELPLEVGYSNVRHFMGVDKSMPAVTDGHYQYGIEIEVEDHTHQLILNKLEALAQAKSDFDAYASEAQSLDNYDVIANRFTKSFIAQQEKKYSHAIKSPWMRTLIHYFLTFSFLRTVPMDSDTVLSLQKMIAPQTGTPRGIIMFQKMVDNILLRASKLIGTKLEENSGRIADTKAIMALTPPIRTFKIEHYFKEAFNSNHPKQVGYDYLSTGTPEESLDTFGLKRMSLSDFETRIDLETLKYFVSNAPEIKIVENNTVYNPSDSIEKMKWTYLTPSNLILPSGLSQCLLAQSFDADKNLAMASVIAAANFNKKSPWGSFAWFAKKKKQKAKKKLAQKKSAQASNVYKNIANMNFASVGASFLNASLISTVASQIAVNPILLQALDFTVEPTMDAADLMGFEWDNIDRLYVTGSDGIETVLDSEEQPDWSVMSSYLLRQSILAGSGMSGFSPQHTLLPAPTPEKVQQNDTFYSLAFYSLSSGNNAIQKLITSVPTNPPSALTNIPRTSTGVVPSLVQNAVLGLPNQIKSLFITDPSTVKQNWHSISGDIFKMPQYFPTVALNYKMLRKVEVFAGYESDSDGRPLLKKPIFQRLTGDIQQASAGKQILCRTVTYRNRDFGVEPPKGLALPVHDKYFIMTLPSAKSVATKLPFELYKKATVSKMLKVNAQMQDVPTEYASTNYIGTNKTVVSQATKAKTTSLYQTGVKLQ